MNKSRSLRIVLYVALIFLAGGVTGVLIAPITGRTFMRPPRPEEMAQHIMERLRSGLSLTDSQVAKIQPLVQKTGADMETIRRETMQQVRHRMDETNAKILAFLTPEQQIAFKKMEADHRNHLRHLHPLGEPPGPPPPDR
jgi:Spy/CpxP family protein refolding chaperone